MIPKRPHRGALATLSPVAGLLRQAAAKMGIEVRRTGADLNQHQQRKLLLDRLAVTLVLDVGANVGQYAGTHLRQWTGYDGRIASFEPAHASYGECAIASRDDDRWRTYAYGLSDSSATLTMRVPEQSGLASVHAPTAEGAKFVGRTSSETIEVKRLDDVIGDVSLPGDVLALKLDVQGHEAAALRGAVDTLARVALLEVELPLVEVYEGQGSFGELLASITAHGFRPVGIYSNYVDSDTGYAVDADVFFVSSRSRRS
jgi:FkbM family methyltransferase